MFQGFNLLARTTALDNVELPLLYGLASERLGAACPRTTHAGCGRTRRPHGPPPEPALGAASSSGSAIARGPGQRAGHSPGGRADPQPGLAHQRRPRCTFRRWWLPTPRLASCRDYDRNPTRWQSNSAVLSLPYASHIGHEHRLSGPAAFRGDTRSPRRGQPAAPIGMRRPSAWTRNAGSAGSWRNPRAAAAAGRLQTAHLASLSDIWRPIRPIRVSTREHRLTFVPASILDRPAISRTLMLFVRDILCETRSNRHLD